MTGTQRGELLLVLRETAGKTGHLSKVVGGVTEQVDDDTLHVNLQELRADLKACKQRALGLIERLEREGDTHDTPA